MRPRRHHHAAVAVAVAVASVAMLPAQAGPPPVRVEGTSADVPMLMRGGQPAVDVTVGGKGPFVFAIDTAASGAARLDASLVKSQSLETVGEARASDGMGGVRMIPIVRAGAITLGGLTWSGIEVPSRDYNTSPSLPKIDGILGAGAFAELLLTLDYPNKRVRITRGELPAPDGKTILPMTIDRGIAQITIDVAGQAVTADLDSGNIAGPVLHVPAALLQKLPTAGPPRDAGTGTTVSSTIALKQVTLTGPVMIGEHTLASRDVIFADQFRNANVGSNVLKEFIVTIDQKNKRVRFEKPAK